MRRRPRVLVDVDGPLTGGFLDAACTVLCDFGIDATPAACTDWDIARSFNATVEQEAEMYRRLRLPGLADCLRPHPGAVEFLGALREWAEVYAVTAPLPGSLTWVGERMKWLDGLGFDRRHVIHADDKRVVAGDAFVDDKPAHVVEWSAAWPAGLAVLWSEPYNELTLWEGPRAKGYAELTEMLGALRAR